MRQSASIARACFISNYDMSDKLADSNISSINQYKMPSRDVFLIYKHMLNALILSPWKLNH